MTLSERIELISTAMDGVTPGPWTVDDERDDYEIDIVGRPSWKCTRFGIEGEWDVAHIEIINDRDAETKANAAYIAACNPVAISELLAAARKAEALQQEVAELRADFDTLNKNVGYELTWGEIDGWPDQCAWRVHRRNGGRNDTEWKLVASGDTAQEALRRARTLLNGGSDAQG